MTDSELLQLEHDGRDLTLNELRLMRQIILEELKLNNANTVGPKYRTLFKIRGNADGADSTSVAWRLLDERAPEWLEQLIEDFFAD